MFDLMLDAVGAVVEGLRKLPSLRLWVTVLSTIVVALALTIWATAPIFFHPDLVPDIRQAAPGVAVMAGVGLFLALISFTSVRIQGGGSARIEVESLREERHRIQQRLAEQPKPDILDTIQLSLNQLSEYYAINKSQARNSFRFSVFAVVVGLATLIGGIWLFYLTENQNIQLTAISGIAGALIQFIGGAYFYLYRKSLDQLNYFFSQLVKMQDTMLSVRLCEQIEPEDRQAELREKVILTLLERSSDWASVPLHPASRKEQDG